MVDIMASKRKAIEMLYIGKCDITVKETYLKENGSTGSRDVVATQNQPCKLSFKNISSVGAGQVANIAQEVKLFIAPEIDIPAGSHILITQNKVTREYKRSGEPAVYGSHQEVILELGGKA